MALIYKQTQRIWTLCLMFCLCATPGFAQDETMVLEVMGEGSGGRRATIEQVEQQARHNAMRKALEQAGIVVSSETTVDLTVVTQDEIRAWTQGLVKVLEVLENTTVFDPNLKAFRCVVRLRVEVRAGDMAALMERVQATKAPEERPVAPSMAFEYALMGQRHLIDGTWQTRQLEDGSTVRSGEELQIWFRPGQDCFAYVINRDASGAVYVLFPHHQAVSNQLEAGKDYLLPSHETAYRFDAVAGLEAFYLVVSPAPMADLSWMIDRMRQTKGETRMGMMAMLDGTLRARGVRGAGTVVPGSRQRFETVNGPATEQVTRMFEGSGARVQVITLNHR